jgi:hypothetical protein
VEHVTLASLEQSVGRVEGKVEMILAEMQHVRKHTDSNTSKIWYGYGVMAGLSVIAGKLAFFPH